MRLMISKLSIALAAFIGFALQPAVQAQTLQTSRATDGSDDYVDWSSIGANGTVLTVPVTLDSHLGDVLTINDAGNYLETRQEQANSMVFGWDGSFALGDTLLYTGDLVDAMGNGSSTYGGPLTIDFGTAVSEVGAQINANDPGAFTAEIQAYDGATPLGAFTENGTTTATHDNSAIFIGVSTPSAEITSVVFSLTTSGGGAGDPTSFAINRLDLYSVPEPGAYALLGSLGVTGAAFLRRRHAR